MNKKRIVILLSVVITVLCTLFNAPYVVKAITYINYPDGEKASTDDVLVPTADNKKGIQGTDFEHGTFPDENPDSLGINHVLLNLELDKVINTDGTGYPYQYNGRTYYFNYNNYVMVFERRAQEYREKGKAITLVLLLGWSDDPAIQNLIYPGGRVKDESHLYYALNVQDAAAKEQLAAAFHFLADVFGRKHCFVQNWIIGNEVNMPNEYNYCGTADLTTNVNICAASFDLLYDALQAENPNAKAYISLTNHWNYDDDGKGMSTKNFIDAFAAKETDKNWNIAFHAYPPNLNELCWSKKSAEWLRHDVISRYVCGANLEVLTDYVKNNYGTSHRIILSEQGFNALTGLDEQAAMMVYTYYAAQRNDMVDAIMFASWVDGEVTLRDGYELGFVDLSGNKRPIYYAFKYMDTPSAAAYTDKYLSTIGISAWTDNMIYVPERTDAVITQTSLYVYENTPTYVKIGMTTKTDKTADVEYRWSFVDSNNNTTVISDWLLNNEWITWTPPANGRYEVVAEARVAANQESYVKNTRVVYYNSTVDAWLTGASMTLDYVSGATVKMQVTQTTSVPTEVEYKWYAIDEASNTIALSDWLIDDGSFTWRPGKTGTYAVVVEVRVAGNPSSMITLTENAYITAVSDNEPPMTTDVVITDAKLTRIAEGETGSNILMEMSTKTSGEAALEYRWTVKGPDGNTTEVQKWVRDNQWLNWNPPAAGRYEITGEVRVAYNKTSYVKDTRIVYFNTTVDAVLNNATLDIENLTGATVKMQVTPATSVPTEVEYKWCAIDEAGQIIPLTDWLINDGSFTWRPGKAGTYVVVVEVRIAGNPASKMTLTDNAYITAVSDSEPPMTTDVVITDAGLTRITEAENGSNIVMELSTKTSGEAALEYRWTVKGPDGNTTEVQKWIRNNQWLNWNPPAAGRYEITGEVRVAYNRTSNRKFTKIVYFNTSVDSQLLGADMVVTNLNKAVVKMQLNASTTSPAELEYQWAAIDSANNIISISAWDVNDGSIVWNPGRAGHYAVVANVRVAGNPSSSLQIVEYVDIEADKDDTPIEQNVVIEDAGLYIAENTRNHILVGMVAKASGPAALEYRWTAVDAEGKKFVVKDWTAGNEWLDWVPPAFGEFTLTGEVRVAANPAAAKTASEVVYFNPFIKGKCQLPYAMVAPGQPGYLIGVETYENPNQKYQYEMLILNCTSMQWVYSTGKFTVSEGAAGWCVWQPEYGYYWTLFRVYDEAGNMIDQACYGFVNAY